MSIELIIVLGLVALGVSMFIKHRAKPVDMNHKSLHASDVVSKTPNGPAKVEKAPAKANPAPKKKVVKKKTTKKKTSTKK